MRLITRLIRALRATLPARGDAPPPARAWAGVIRLRLLRAQASHPGR